MIYILKKYISIYNSSNYSIASIKNLLLVLLSGFLFYIQGTKGNIDQLNYVVITSFSILMVMFSCSSINNELFIKVNKKYFSKEKIYKKIIASNINCILQLILFILALIVVNMLFHDYIRALTLLLQIIPTIILSMAVGNFLFITNKKEIILNITTQNGKEKVLAIKQSIKQFVISAIAGIVFYYLYVKYNSPISILLILIFYILSLLINERFDTSSS